MQNKSWEEGLGVSSNFDIAFVLHREESEHLASCI